MEDFSSITQKNNLRPSSRTDSKDMLYFPALMLVTFFIALYGKENWIINIILWPISMCFHEPGHAIISWLCGIPAIPTFGMSVRLTSSFSFLFFLIFLLLLSLTFYTARKAGYLFITYSSIGLIVSLLLFSLVLPKFYNTEQIILYGGLGGELFLSTVVILTFFVNLPRYFNWRKNRFLVCSCAALFLWYTALFWLDVSANHALLPRGGFFDVNAWFGGQSSGDIDRLQREFGWDDNFIVHVYLITGLVCLLILLFGYSVAVLYYFKDLKLNSSRDQRTHIT